MAGRGWVGLDLNRGGRTYPGNGPTSGHLGRPENRLFKYHGNQYLCAADTAKYGWCAKLLPNLEEFSSIILDWHLKVSISVLVCQKKKLTGFFGN